MVQLSLSTDVKQANGPVIEAFTFLNKKIK